MFSNSEVPATNNQDNYLCFHKTSLHKINNQVINITYYNIIR